MIRGGVWNKDVLGEKKVEKLTIAGGTIIRDSRVYTNKKNVYLVF